MHRVVPELIVENYRLGRYRGEFPSVVMFLDLSGFSTMTDALMHHGQHGAEVLAGLMHGVFDPLVESVFDYGGKIVGFAGDGMMALYPIEADQATTALQALTSAYVIQKRLREQALHTTVYGKFAVSAKIGLAVGSVSWGILRSPDESQATYYFRGAAVDQAAEAEHHASAGDILLTPEIANLLAESIESTPCDSFLCLREIHFELPSPRRTSFPPVDLDVSRLFMPSEVIAYEVRGEFRQVVNLFTRFPDLSESQLHSLMTKVFELRSKYGGLLSRLDFGDKGCTLLILWGAPVAYENDIGRALNFLLDLKSQVDFPITSGVTYYIAHAGYLGSSMCEDYTCYGWGVNLASRFMMSAPSGETWVDDRIARRVAKRFEIDFVGTQLFKGFGEVQKVHRLSGHKRTPGPAYQGELVGRDPELAQLAAFLEPLWKNRFAGLMLVSGDAGIGKGRLVYELHSSKTFEGRSVLWAVCQSDQILRQSFNPLRSWLFQYFTLSSDQSVEERRQAFDTKLENLLASISDATLANELDRIRSVLGALIDLHWDHSLYEDLDAEGRYNNTFLALIALLKAESLCQPVVLLLEDLQFMDQDSRDFLPRLKRSILAAGELFPIAILVTTRPFEGGLDADLINARLELHGLDENAVARLAETILGGSVDPQLVNILVNRSEGNPYFVEQIIRYLQEENYLETSKSGWTLVRRLRINFIPGDIRAILVARLDQLAHEVKESVQTASVLGREFELRVFLQMLRDDPRVEDYISEAEKAAIWMPLSEMKYIFSHGLLRDAAYEMQMRARRRELHALAVEALEAIYPEDLKNRAAELAYHAEYGELFAKAQFYFTLAGRSAADLYQNHQAIDYYTRALANTPTEDLSTRFSLLVERVELSHRLGDRPSHLKDLETLQGLAVQLNELRLLARVESLFAYYYVSVSDFAAVLRHAERVMSLNQTGELEDILLDTYHVWPLALLRLGKLEDAMRVAHAGRQLAQSHGDPVREGYILNAMGLIAIEQQDPTVAHGYLEQALSIAMEKGDRRLESRTLGNLGTSAGYVRKDYAAARAYYERAYALMHERGERSAECVALGNLGWVSAMEGNYSSAPRYQKQALTIAREVGNLYLETYMLLNLSASHGGLNQAETSLAYAKSALELSQKIGDRSAAAWSYLYTGYAYLSVSALDQAEAAFRQSIAIREELGHPGMKVESIAGLIQALFQKRNYRSALTESEKIMAFLDAGGSLEGVEEPLRIYYACYLALERVQDPRAQGVLHTAIQLLEAQVSKLKNEKSRQMYIENVPWRRAIWQFSADKRSSFTGTDRPGDPLH